MRYNYISDCRFIDRELFAIIGNKNGNDEGVVANCGWLTRIRYTKMKFEEKDIMSVLNRSTGGQVLFDVDAVTHSHLHCYKVDGVRAYEVIDETIKLIVMASKSDRVDLFGL